MVSSWNNFTTSCAWVMRERKRAAIASKQVFIGYKFYINYIANIKLTYYVVYSCKQGYSTINITIT
jgi:hypothetical protein